MSTALHRRDILRAGLAGAAALSAPRFALAQGAPELSAEALRGGLIAVRGAGGNVVAGAGENGLVLVDGGLKAHADALFDFIAGETGEGRVATLFNTHWHDAQTGLNEMVGASDGRIVAHKNTQLWLAHEHWVQWEDKTYPPLPDAALPDQTFYDGWSGDYAGAPVEAAWMMQAHTDGDIYVRFAGPNVIASGEVGRTDAWPILDWSTGGWLGGYIDGLDILLEAADDETMIVPAEGPTVDKAELIAQRDMYNEILQRLASSLRSSHGFKEMIAADPTAGFRPEWGDPERFLIQAYRGIWGHIRQDRRVSTI